MANVTQYEFSLQEVAKALILQQDLHEGLWQLAINFSFAASNIATDEKKTGLRPAALIAVQNLMLAKCTELSDIAVDAAVVNPLKTKTKQSKQP